jgi:hypothetical protein
MCRHRTASATIAQLMVAVFVSLHRDSESAGKSLSQLEKNISPVGKMKNGFWEIFQDASSYQSKLSTSTPSPDTSPSLSSF